ncbi:MAG: hypothetical protein IPP90_03930 [Gemmatimonadaceae bacterium]|nr:hypothetical protein [Gemmatimonadaceae bacterium]
MEFVSSLDWNPERPRILVAACSDGRLQEATDDFLSRHLGIQHYDRLYAPGGAGALCPSGRDFMRAHALQGECRYLVAAHGVEQLILLFHGPAPDGPTESICADYRRKQPWATDAQIRAQQEKDTEELLAERWQWSGKAKVSIYRCEVGSTGGLQFVTLHLDLDAPKVR